MAIEEIITQIKTGDGAGTMLGNDVTGARGHDELSPPRLSSEGGKWLHCEEVGTTLGTPILPYLSHHLVISIKGNLEIY